MMNARRKKFKIRSMKLRTQKKTGVTTQPEYIGIIIFDPAYLAVNMFENRTRKFRYANFCIFSSETTPIYGQIALFDAITPTSMAE
jgi:hypothetical protein